MTGYWGTWLHNIDGFGRHGDPDWYRISVPYGTGCLYVECRFVHSEGDIDITLLDASGNSVGSSNSSYKDIERICYDSPSAGTYYIRVYQLPYNGNMYDLYWGDNCSDAIALIYPPDGVCMPGCGPEIILRWERSDRVNRYEVEVDDDPNFGSPCSTVWDSLTTEIEACAECSNIVPGVYYWRVRGRVTSPCNTWGEWNSRSFKVAPTPGTLTILGPAEGCGGEVLHFCASATGVPTSWQWSSNCGGSFNTPNQSCADMTLPNGYSGDCSITMSVCIGECCATITKHVTINQEPDRPELSASIEKVCMAEEFCLYWTPISDAISYEIKENDEPWIDVGEVTDTCFAKPTADNFTYYVRAKNACGHGEPSAAMTVEVQGVPSAPALVGPPDWTSELIEPVTLDWENSPATDKYQVQVDSNQSFSNPLIDAQPVLSSFSTSGLPGGYRLYWRVRSHNMCGWGEWSTPSRSFAIECPELIPIPDHSLIPPDGTHGSNAVAFNWDINPLAYKYCLQVDTTSCQFNDIGSLYLDTLVESPPVEVDLAIPEFAQICWRVAPIIPPLCGSGDTVFTSPSQYLDVEELATLDLPDHFALSQNYPNPFNPDTRIEFALPRASHVTMDVYNLLGMRVMRLVNERLPAGHKLVTWDGRDESGKPVSSGIYFYRMVAGDFAETKKLVLMK